MSAGQRSISVSAATHAYLTAAAKARGTTMAALVEAAVADLPADPPLIGQVCSACRRMEPHRQVVTTDRVRLTCTRCGRALELPR